VQARPLLKSIAKRLLECNRVEAMAKDLALMQLIPFAMRLDPGLAETLILDRLAHASSVLSLDRLLSQVSSGLTGGEIYDRLAREIGENGTSLRFVAMAPSSTPTHLWRSSISTVALRWSSRPWSDWSSSTSATCIVRSSPP
jgi:hypothetical protein